MVTSGLFMHLPPAVEMAHVKGHAEAIHLALDMGHLNGYPCFQNNPE